VQGCCVDRSRQSLGENHESKSIGQEAMPELSDHPA
jgi:hypothetical protein